MIFVIIAIIKYHIAHLDRIRAKGFNYKQQNKLLNEIL